MSVGGNKSADEAVSDALLEKLRNHATKPQEPGDALRTTVAKIHARATSSGTCPMFSNSQFPSYCAQLAHDERTIARESRQQ